MTTVRQNHMNLLTFTNPKGGPGTEEVSAIICDMKNEKEMEQDLFTGLNNFGSREMSKNEKLYVEEVKKVRERLAKPQEIRRTGKNQIDMDQIESRFRLQALCNEDNAFQKYKNGILFDDKIDVMNLVKEGKAENLFKQRNKSVIDHIDSTQPESPKGDNNGFRLTMEKFKSMSVDPKMRRRKGLDLTNDFGAHFIKILPPNTPMNKNGQRIIKKPAERKQQRYKFPIISKIKGKKEFKGNMSTHSSLKFEEATGSSTNREKLHTSAKFESPSVDYNRSSFLITENKQDDISPLKTPQKRRKKIKLTKIKMPTTSKYSNLKKSVFNRDLRTHGESRRRSNRFRSTRFSLPPPPKANDPDIKLLCKRLSGNMLSKKIQDRNKEHLGLNKSKITGIIKKCFEYELDDDIPFQAKYNYRMFLEHYYQKKFDEMIEITTNGTNYSNDAKLAKRYFDYSFMKITEGMIQAHDIVKEYKSGLADPCRQVAMHEKSLSSKAGRLNKRR